MAFRKTCEIVTFNSKRNERQLRNHTIIPSLCVLLYVSVHIHVVFPRFGAECVLNNLEIWLSHQMLKSSSRDPRNFGTRHRIKVTLTAAYGTGKKKKKTRIDGNSIVCVLISIMAGCEGGCGVGRWILRETL